MLFPGNVRTELNLGRSPSSCHRELFGVGKTPMHLVTRSVRGEVLYTVPCEDKGDSQEREN